MSLGLLKVTFYTLYHGKSPSNHHLGEYFSLSKHLKQIQMSRLKTFQWNCCELRGEILALKDSNFCPSEQLKKGRWLFVGDDKPPSDVGILIKDYKDPY